MGDPKMNMISMKEIKLFGYTGCLPVEKENGQYFYVSVDFLCDEIPGAVTDRLEDTINYDEAYGIIEEIVTSSRFNLIEHLAHEIGNALITRYELARQIHVTVKKPDAPVNGIFDAMETRIGIIRREAVIGLGSNMGDRKGYLKSALEKIRQNPAVRVKRVSSVYETEPVGYADQEDFLNCCAVIETYLEPRELLSFLQGIETASGRVRTIRNGPRTIDLDILLIEDMRIERSELTVPHPRMYERAFVLEPLRELGLYVGPVPEGSRVRKLSPKDLSRGDA